MTTSSPPSAEPEAVRIARDVLKWGGDKASLALAMIEDPGAFVTADFTGSMLTMARHILRDHEQRKRYEFVEDPTLTAVDIGKSWSDHEQRESSREGMPAMIEHARAQAGVAYLTPEEGHNYRRALLAAHERIAALDNELSGVVVTCSNVTSDPCVNRIRSLRTQAARDESRIAALEAEVGRMAKDRDEALTVSINGVPTTWRVDMTLSELTTAMSNAFLAVCKERDSARAEVEALRGERDALTARLDEEERACHDVMEQRDHFNEQIDAIADALGDEGEWSNMHDRGDAALELAEAVRAALGEALDIAAAGTKAMRDLAAEFGDDFDDADVRIAELRQLATKESP